MVVKCFSSFRHMFRKIGVYFDKYVAGGRTDLLWRLSRRGDDKFSVSEGQVHHLQGCMRYTCGIFMLQAQADETTHPSVVITTTLNLEELLGLWDHMYSDRYSE